MSLIWTRPSAVANAADPPSGMRTIRWTVPVPIVKPPVRCRVPRSHTSTEPLVASASVRSPSKANAPVIWPTGSSNRFWRVARSYIAPPTRSERPSSANATPTD
ncbi:hypothetical protein SK571_34755 [Lentzea sp. BCCO 10_0798]|uniref:Uncharacterized protein n=1 Tax=Lentzea kristufekii TaxID=3095430 RepID=A0ABU4U3J4_9PSEU|nr:hypothetical protein [Lentzea sp. BCCO 10_0798]MDX8054556.1 hypothetical protein [Lentzea sp. BCCO 10_0798]